MKNLTNILFAGLIFGSSAAYAGEGHDHNHDAPGVLKAQRGGRIQPALGGLLIELVVDKTAKTLKFYPTNAEYQALPLKDVQISVTTLRRRVDKTPLPLKLDAKTDHFVGTFDPEGRYPYNVDLKSTYQKHEDTMQFIVDRN